MLAFGPVDYDKVWRPVPEPDPMGFPEYVRKQAAPVAEPSSSRWVRFPDETTWHVQTGPDSGARIQRCTGSVRLPSVGEARLEMTCGAIFGPACPLCAKLEGCHDD